MNGTVLAFTLLVGLLVGIVVGLAPAIQVSHLHPNEELKATVQGVLGPSGRQSTFRDLLVAGEIAISLALLVGAGLLLRTFAKLHEVDAGIHPEGILTAQIGLPANRYNKIEQAEAFFDRLLGGLKGSPGVEASAVGSQLPLEGGSNSYITIDGRPHSEFANILVEQNAITPEYFKAFGIPFLKGRNFIGQDFRDTAESGGRPWP